MDIETNPHSYKQALSEQILVTVIDCLRFFTIRLYPEDIIHVYSYLVPRPEYKRTLREAYECIHLLTHNNILLQLSAHFSSSLAHCP